MTRFIEIVESSTESLALDDEEATLLNTLGAELASKSRFWGETDVPDENEPRRKRSVITCTSNGEAWTIFVSNAVGLIKVRDLQITVRPKIPLEHFIYLLSFSELAPRTIAEPIEASPSADFLELIAYWFMNALERILRLGLVLDYAETSDELKAVRGQLSPMPTSQNFLSGRLYFSCRFDDFSLDTALNRLLRSATISVLARSEFARELRRRAFRALERLGNVRDLKQSDFMAFPDRRTAHYSDGLRLARLLLKSEARTIQRGGGEAWSFLVPTAGAVEEGIRTILREGLSPNVSVSKRGKQLRASRLTINPDLVFDPNLAVGDVKYKIYSSDWLRSDLYQAVAFASGYGVKRGILVSFSDQTSDALPSVNFDDITISNIVWETMGESPEIAARRIVDDVFQQLVAMDAQVA